MIVIGAHRIDGERPGLTVDGRVFEGTAICGQLFLFEKEKYELVSIVAYGRELQDADEGLTARFLFIRSDSSRVSTGEVRIVG